MKGIFTILAIVGSLLISLAGTSSFVSSRKHEAVQADSIRNSSFDGDGKTKRSKMTHSAYPVQLQVVGGAVRVDSPECQILPIYTQNGTFFLIMRLNKGINWLNGLPKGKYFINNRIVVIK